MSIAYRYVIVLTSAALAALFGMLVWFVVHFRRRNRQLEASMEQCRIENKTKDKLFSIIGHDLRGPIGNISSLLTLYRKHQNNEDEKEYILDALEESTLAAETTLSNLLDWGKLKIKGIVHVPSVFNASAAIEKHRGMLRLMAGNKNITIHNHVPINCNVSADIYHFDFIIRNLLTNAVKFTRSNGFIDVSAESADGMIVFAVRDNGIGMETAQQMNIFSPSNSSTSGTANETGNSIGLMLCKEFVAQNGGKIWFESQKGEGTTFYFTAKQAHPMS